MGMGVLGSLVVGGGLTCGFWVVFEGALEDLFVWSRRRGRSRGSCADGGRLRVARSGTVRVRKKASESCRQRLHSCLLQQGRAFDPAM